MSLNLGYSGTLIWKNEKGQFHREKGPALIFTNAGVRYALNDNSHRLDGPALIYPDRDKEYWIYGTEYTKAEYYAKVKEL